MMRSLAERAPMLFRKNVISVDILTQSEEQVLEAITGCFSQSGGVPELGLGNAEVNVVFSTWWLHLTLCENARHHRRWSVIGQWVMWGLSLTATLVAVLSSSMGSGIIARMNGLAPGPYPFKPPEADDPPPPDPDPPAADPAPVEEAPVDACARRMLELAQPLIHHAVGRSLMLTDALVHQIHEYLNLSIIILPITLALVVTVNSRMAWRDKWSVCIMAADTLTGEIYKFRMGTCEYDQNKPAGKDADGNDLPPLSAKEKSRIARALFVSRVQSFYGAAVTELSQASSLRMTRVLRSKKIAPESQLINRANQEEKPTLAQWFQLKEHVERHYHRTAWVFPRGISFLLWMSALRPYLSQKTMKEEMKETILELVEQSRVRLRGTEPLTDSESKLIRRTLAAKLGLPGHMFDSVKDEIRVLQRTVVVSLAEEEKKKAIKQGESDVEAGTSAVDDGAGVISTSTPSKGGMAAMGAAMGAAMKTTKSKEEDIGDDSTMRDIIMDMQGLGKPRTDDNETLKRVKSKQRKINAENRPNRLPEDDYLCGPLTLDTYMCYRVRPVIAKFQKHANKLSWRLSFIEIIGFCIQSSGSIFGTMHFDEWVAFTVAIAAVLQSFIEFMQLRNQVTSLNLALRDLQGLCVFWDSLSIVRRRTAAVKMQVVASTETAILMVTDAHTTASSNTITSVAKQLAQDADQSDAAEAE